MVTRRGAGTHFFVFLMYCWPKVQLRPMGTHSDTSSELLSFRSLDEVATLFDEILVQEILDPKKLTFLETLSPAATLPTEKTTEKNVPLKENQQSSASEKQQSQLSAPKKQESQSSPQPVVSLFSEEEEKEALYQIKTLSALEKIIDSLQRVLRESLKKKRRLLTSMLKARYLHSNKSLP
ncbi:PREDICTED: protein SPACA7-like isoform X2 [Chinchilla lanigera]|uniref:Protein SPACA7-like n=1 Tax=Chinchilla lanigera TaxID=34839 RepID=A0A8C2VXN1_CHILA|nr:PREDICTED: protein SPACA7-like isoform X2 [Chinchilla lanigera]